MHQCIIDDWKEWGSTLGHDARTDTVYSDDDEWNIGECFIILIRITVAPLVFIDAWVTEGFGDMVEEQILSIGDWLIN